MLAILLPLAEIIYRSVDEPIESISVNVVAYTSFGVITPSADVLSPQPSALYFSAAGDLTMEDEDAVVVTITVTASQWLNGISPTKITTWTGTAGAVTWYA